MSNNTMTTQTRTYTVGDVLLSAFKAKQSTVLVTQYTRDPECKHPTMWHLWGNGTFRSYMLAWRTNPSGQQPCGCLMEYGEV